VARSFSLPTERTTKPTGAINEAVTHQIQTNEPREVRSATGVTGAEPRPADHLRGMRINGQRVATWSSQHGWSGDTRPDGEWQSEQSERPLGHWF
jgi:hypothetical protein